MKHLELYANVNPLNPNEYLIVADSRTIGIIKESDQWEIMTKKGRQLKQKGYTCYILEKITTRFEF